MNRLLPALLTCSLLSTALAEKTVPLGNWGEITVPEEYKTGEAFPVTVTIKKLADPTQLVIDAHWQKAKKRGGGFLQNLNIAEEITQTGAHEFEITIDKVKPGMSYLSLLVYLSPDGTWGNKTQKESASVLLFKSREKKLQDLAAASEKTQKTAPFFMKRAPKLPSLAAGGFQETPSVFDDFEQDWPQKDKLWEVADWKQNGSQMRVENCKPNADGYLVQTLTTEGDGGSMQSRQEYSWGRWIARVKPSSVPGALNSIFTKDWDDRTTPTPDNDGKGAEIDIEMLTHTFGENKGEVHLAIHLKDYMPLWHLDIPLDFNPSDDFHEWGFDVLPDRVIWHVDGRILHEWKYTDRFYIDPNYEFFFNSWTMKKWIQGPPKEEAHYLIDWVKFYPYKQD